METINFQALIPLCFLFLSAIWFGVMLHTRSQSVRLYLSPIFLFLSYHALAGPDQFYFSFSLMSIWNLAVGLYVVHVISLILIERTPSPSPYPGLSSLETWKWRCATTYRYWGNPRIFLPGPELEAQQPSLRSFVVWRISKLLFYYMVHARVMPTINDFLIGQIAPSDVSAEQQKLFRSLFDSAALSTGLLSARQLKSRAVLVRVHTAVFWIWESVVFLDSANAALALFFVCVVRVDRIADWPPLFGSLAEAMSVTTFWSRFWHQLATRPYVNIARWINQSVLHLGRKNVFAKILVAAIVFALSGCNHALVTWRAGLRDWDLEIRWFMLNFCACALERSAILLLQTAASWLGVRKWWVEHWAGVMAGRVWLLLFFCWSVPKWQYPRMEKQAIAFEEIEELRRILSAS